MYLWFAPILENPLASPSWEKLVGYNNPRDFSADWTERPIRTTGESILWAILGAGFCKSCIYEANCQNLRVSYKNWGPWILQNLLHSFLDKALKLWMSVIIDGWQAVWTLICRQDALKVNISTQRCRHVPSVTKTVKLIDMKKRMQSPPVCWASCNFQQVSWMLGYSDCELRSTGTGVSF